MTYSSLLKIMAGLAFLAPLPANASDPFMPQTLPVELNPMDSEQVVLGELTFSGGVEIEPGEEGIGGLSGLEWYEGQLYAVSSDNRWLVIAPDEILGRLADIVEIEMGELLDERGKRQREDDGSAQSLTLQNSGQWSVGFDKSYALAYSELHGEALSRGSELALAPDAALLEQYGNTTGVDCAGNGVCFYLFSNSSDGSAAGSRVVAVGPDGLHETIALWEGQMATDDFSGLAIRESGERTFLYLVSNSGFSEDKRTVLMKFEVSERAASAPGVPPKVYETVDVVIETAMGEITVRLETERAPITAANFLRYVAEDRYDDTKCYRAMRIEGGPQPSGFLQCGTQNRADRILPGIPHEPTTQTGLSHTDGALSMARFEPGTATGDFSIMIRDQRGLDAYPEADDPALHDGFAVFGYVIDGMDVVHAIHATETDPDAGKGFLKGQMLAEPVTIIDMQRVEYISGSD